jgi:hypothetical protein
LIALLFTMYHANDRVKRVKILNFAAGGFERQQSFTGDVYHMREIGLC